MRVLSILILGTVATSAHAGLQTFVSKRCLDCHDNETREGGLSLQSLGYAINKSNAKRWLRVLEHIEHGYMPPPAEEQPLPRERRAAIVDLETRLVTYHRKVSPQKPAMLRRLNRTEYRNTIRDLLHLHMGTFDPTRKFPDDVRSHGFPTSGEKLVTSSFLVHRYLDAAEQIVSRAIHFEPKPKRQHWKLLPPFSHTRRNENTYGELLYFKRLKQPQPYQTIYNRMRGLPKRGYHPIDKLSAGVPVSGWYTIRILAEAKFRYADLDPSKFHYFPPESDASEPIRLSLFSGTLQGIDPENLEALETAATQQQPGESLLATWDLPDNKKVWLQCRVWLDRGYFPRLGYPNGPSNSNYRMYSYFRENKHVLLNKQQLEKFEAQSPSDWQIYMWFESPRIQISQIEVDGPLNDRWPPASHRVVFGKGRYTRGMADKVLLEFASRAWRHPVTSEDVAPIVHLVHADEQRGMTPQTAIQDGLKAILSSPEFLYREEKHDLLDGYEIASRLSYFLWSSMPDESLLKHAAAGDLSRTDVLRRESTRLLNDVRSEAFVNEFLDGWVGLRKLGTMSPDAARFAVYYRDALEPAMRTETRLFFHQLLNSNGSIDKFLDSDYTFLNKNLAKLYNIDPKRVTAGQGQNVEGLSPRDLKQDAGGNAPSLAFARVKLTDARRGGLLGQASVLTLTANGVDTSPVIRGVWLLKNILGTPPSPPPPNVPKPEPDTRGTTTIRDRLRKHRESASCRSCHQHIDPPGFALESFDAIGHWRGHYRLGSGKHVPIDTSGQFGASKFRDVVGFKVKLLEHREQFARCLVEKLLIHALGRDLEITDRPEIRRIVETAAKNGYRLRDLVFLCIESPLFKRK